MLTAKGQRPPHLLVMTATPIPRTLQLANHGEMDVSQLDEMPPGRTPVDTRVISLDRLDDVIVFHSLDKQALMKILDLEIGKVVERLEKKDINLVLDEKARDFIVEKGHDPEYGARPMRRAVEQFMEELLKKIEVYLSVV